MDGFFIFLLLVILLYIIVKAIQNAKREEQVKSGLKILREGNEHRINMLKEKRDELLERLNAPLLSAKAFYDATGLLGEMMAHVRSICKESAFMEYIEGIKADGGDNIDSSDVLFDSLKFFIVKDIIRLYELQGKSKCLGIYDGKEINLKTYSGQLMYCLISTLMKHDKKSIYTYHDYETEMNDYSIYAKQNRSIISNALKVYANADVKASASDGHEDFSLCIVLHNYNDEHENEYRMKMERMGKMIDHDAVEEKQDEVILPFNETNTLNEAIDVTYSVMGYDEAGKTTFEMEVSERDMGWLMDAESEGEYLDSDFIFENRKKLHRKILRAIRNNMEELGMNPDDGMVEKRYASLVKEFHPEASHQEMYYSADDDAIEYTITL